MGYFRIENHSGQNSFNDKCWWNKSKKEQGFLYFDAVASLAIFLNLLLGILLYWHSCMIQLKAYEQDEQMIQQTISYIEIGKNCYATHFPLPLQTIKKGIFTYVMEQKQEILQEKTFDVYYVKVYKADAGRTSRSDVPYYELHTLLYRKE